MESPLRPTPAAAKPPTTPSSRPTSSSDPAMTGSTSPGPATTVTRNLAVHNANLGIEAIPGVIDGGGNRAFGNGNPAQCINIACRTQPTHDTPAPVHISARPGGSRRRTGAAGSSAAP